MPLLSITSTQPVNAAGNPAPGSGWVASPLGRSGEVSSSFPSAQAQTTLFYLGQWEGKLDEPGAVPYWGPQFPLDGWIDLRPLALQAIAPTEASTQCCLLGVASDPVPFFPGWTQLATSTDTLAIRLDTLETRLALKAGTLTATTLGELAYQLFAEHPKAPPLSPNKNLVYTATIGNIRLFSVPLDYESTAWANTKQLLVDAYDQLRTESLAKGDETYLKWLELQSQKYRIDYRELLGDNPDEGTREPATTFTENFNCANTEPIGCDLTWVESLNDTDIGSNDARCQVASGECILYSTSAVSSTDHHTIANTSTPIGSVVYAGPTVRHSTSADTFYVCERRDNSTDTWRIAKVVSGSRTSLATTSNGTAPGDSDWVKCDISGSDLEMFADAATNPPTTSRVTVTDSSITTGTNGGLYGWENGSGRARWDDWTIDDGGAAPAARRITITLD